ncbi:MAG: DUF2242 domain-containing protein [Burkholderiales bacterium]|jgi:hypothetical protein|nr:DUF2242 domain-containing protein [Burkholderiales bacterium]
MTGTCTLQSLPLPLRFLWPALRRGLWLVPLLAGCTTPPPPHYGPQERFSSVATYSRLFDAAPAQTCEAARRALLSQGYLIQGASAEQVEGRKNFQPDAESHLEILIRVVCVPDAPQGVLSTGFVTAVQDRYTVKKVSNSASLGVGGIGSLSVPLTASSEALVRVGSETIASEPFYDSFFDLVRSYLAPAEPQED